jgi:hypothetical protein
MTLTAVIGAISGGNASGESAKNAANASGGDTNGRSMIVTIETAGVIATVGDDCVRARR